MRLSPVLLLATVLSSLGLGGCVSDSASYKIGDDREHAVTLMRSQNLFWSDAVSLSIIAARQPDCYGGLSVEGVPRNEVLPLHLAPDEYPEPLLILTAAGADYAISTRSCRVQRFVSPVANKGRLLGRFEEQDGALTFRAEPSR